MTLTTYAVASGTCLPLGIGLEILLCSFAMYLLRLSNSDRSSGWGWKWVGDANPKGNVGFVFESFVIYG